MWLVEAATAIHILGKYFDSCEKSRYDSVRDCMVQNWSDTAEKMYEIYEILRWTEIIGQEP